VYKFIPSQELLKLLISQAYWQGIPKVQFHLCSNYLHVLVLDTLWTVCFSSIPNRNFDV